MRITRSALIIATCALFPACADGPVDPGSDDLSPAFAKPDGAGGGKGGGKGGGGGDDGGGTASTVTFAERAGDGIRSDGGGGYVDGSQRVSISLNSTGDLVFLTKDGGRSVERPLCMDVSTPLSVSDQNDLATFESVATSTGSLSNLCIDVRLQTKRPDQGTLAAMAVGASQTGAGTVYLAGLDTSKKTTWEWRLQFNTIGDIMDANGELGGGTCITRDSDTQWTISVTAGCGVSTGGQTVDDVLELWHFKDGKNLVATYAMPTEFVLVIG